jgi:hypothetical protein
LNLNLELIKMAFNIIQKIVKLVGKKDEDEAELEMVLTVVSGRLNVIKGLKPTNQIVSFERTRHIIRL